MTGARLVDDTLEQEGWSVEIADAQKVKGLAPLACKTDKIDSLVLAALCQRDLVPTQTGAGRRRSGLWPPVLVVASGLRGSERGSRSPAAGGAARDVRRVEQLVDLFDYD
jgi:hypothetical protein